MALQLIDLNEDIEYINIDASKVPYSFSIKLTAKKIGRASCRERV